MWLIKRVYMDGVGHEEAFYKDLMLDYIGLAQVSVNTRESNSTRNARTVTSTYQQLVNGGGKSTYIALLLSIFEPSTNDFTQYLANRRQSEYHYRNYFYKELSVILVAMVNEAGNTLLLGHAHQRNGDEVDRTLFICDAPDSLLGSSFDEVPSYSRAERNPELRSFANSLHSFESWLNFKAGGEDGIHWRKTSRQNEWREFLLEQGINVDLIKTMVTFNSEEGGLTRFIDYKTELDFLGAFFACTMSKKNAEQLRGLVSHEVERQSELEGIRRNESFLKDVLANWRVFLEPAKRLESTQLQQQLLDDGFRESMRDLTAFIEDMQVEHRQLEEGVADLQNNIDQAVSHQVLLSKRKALLDHELVLDQLNKQKAVVEVFQGQAEANQCQIEINRSALDYKEYAKAQTEYRKTEEDLKVFQSETEKPLQVIFERTAGEALGLLKSVLESHHQQEAKINEELEQLDNEINTLRESHDKQLVNQGELKAKRNNYQKDKREGELQRDEFCNIGLIHKGEPPAVAQHRLESVLRDAQQFEELANISFCLKEQEVKAQNVWVQEALMAQMTAKQTLTDIEQKHRAAVDSMHVLGEGYRALPATTQCALGFEGSSWYCKWSGWQQIEKVLDADEQKLNGIKQRLLNARFELDELKQTGHELVTKQVNQALEAFYAAGIAQDKLWAFPHYLAAAFNDDAEKIAGIIDNNPGRYLSLVALDEATLEQARKVSESLSWKKSPIAIHLLDEAPDLWGKTPALMQVVLSNPDKYGYSLAAYKSRLQELEGAVASQEDSLSAAESAFKILESFKGDWRLHYDRHGKHWSTLIDQRAQARLTLNNAEAELNQAQRHEQMLCDEKTEALDRLHSAKEQKASAEKEHDKLTRFIETLWARCETALIKIVQLTEEIQRNEEDILRLKDALERKQELIKNKRTEQNQISNQIDRWNRLRNEPFYSGVTATEMSEQRSPDDAHSKAVQANTKLQEALQGDEVIALKQQRAHAEQVQRNISQQLSSQTAWQEHQHEVKEVSVRDSTFIHDQISHLKNQQQQLVDKQITAKASVQSLSQQCAEARKSLDEYFVWEEQPSGGDAIRRSLDEIIHSLHEIQHHLKRQREQKSLQSDKVINAAARLQSAKTAQAMIQSHTPTSAAGLPVRIVSITDYSSTLAAQCKRYAGLNEALKQQNSAVATVWGRFRKRIDEESAKNPESRASQEYLQQLDLIATYTEVLGDLNRVGTGIAQVYDAVQDSLEQFQRSIDLTVSHLTAHLEVALKLLKRAMTVKIPDDCPVLPGRPIIRMSNRLNDIPGDLSSYASSRLQNWIARGQIPRAPNRDALTADLVQSVFSEGELEVRLLKTNASRPQWLPITRLEGSGGQRLTSAFLLFVTVGKVREYDSGIPGAGFLLADNPLGKSNADDLMRIQTQMAKAYNIQLIYLTGISDENAQSMFDNHLFLNKVLKLKRRDLVTVDKERHALWAASLVARPNLGHISGAENV